MHRLRCLALIVIIATTVVSCVKPAPRVTHTEHGVVIQSGVVKAARATKHDQYVRAVIEFPEPFNSNDVSVQVYPLNGPGKIWVMDVSAVGFTYFILATIVNLPTEAGTMVSEAHFYEGDLKWVAVGY